MIDVTLPSDFPSDLARICQPGAKVYFPKLKEFGSVVKFMDVVHIKLDQGKASSTKELRRDEFLDMLLSDEVVAKSRVVVPEDDNKPMKIKPRAKASAVEPVKIAQVSKPVSAPSMPVVQPSAEPLETGYICESTGKFSKTLQKGYVEIQYRRVTTHVSLKVDSVQLAKLKELGIIEE